MFITDQAGRGRERRLKCRRPLLVVVGGTADVYLRLIVVALPLLLFGNAWLMNVSLSGLIGAVVAVAYLYPAVTDEVPTTYDVLAGTGSLIVIPVCVTVEELFVTVMVYVRVFPG